MKKDKMFPESKKDKMLPASKIELFYDPKRAMGKIFLYNEAGGGVEIYTTVELYTYLSEKGL